MKAVIYFTEVPEKYLHKNMEHMIGEKLLATGLYKEYGLKLAFEPRAAGEHGKPFLTLQPKIHYNISHSGKYVMCIIAGEEVGIDVQEHKKVNYERMLTRMVPADMYARFLRASRWRKPFYPVGAQRSLHQMDGRRSFQRPPQDLPGQRQLPDA